MRLLSVPPGTTAGQLQGPPSRHIEGGLPHPSQAGLGTHTSRPLFGRDLHGWESKFWASNSRARTRRHSASERCSPHDLLRRPGARSHYVWHSLGRWRCVYSKANRYCACCDSWSRLEGAGGRRAKHSREMNIFLLLSTSFRGFCGSMCPCVGDAP